MRPAVPSWFQFRGHALRSFSFTVLSLSEEATQAAEDAGGWRYAVLMDRAVSDPVLEQEHTTVVVDLSVALQWTPSPGPLELLAEVRGVFSYAADAPSEDVERLCRVHAPALLYGQLRPLVRMHAAEAGHPQFTLPLVNVAETFRTHDDQVATHDEGSDDS